VLNFESRFLKCAGRNIHFLEGGNPDHDAIVIWHGVTGTCRDHVELADRLSEKYHVICPDAIGCGLSDWIRDKNTEPGLTFYSEVARDLLKQLNIKKCGWIGSSKGGGLGIILANIMTECPITHLVINDVGPGLPEWMRTAAMKNIASPPRFDSYLQFEENLRQTLSRGKLNLPDHKWRHLALTWSRRTDDGRITFHNDPALAFQFTHHPHDFNLWDHYDQISIPTLFIRGEYSLVDDQEADAMRTRGPKCTIFNRPGGHISLMDDVTEQDVILDFIKTEHPTQTGENHEQSYG
tara:strand:+ start:5351 stop:6232 length:882 start_codon:yes stop_codon:yes gene_type:complete